MMCSEPLNHCGACLIQSDYFHLSAMAAELENNVIQRSDSRDVPEMCGTYIYVDLFWHILEVESADKGIR